MFTSIASSFSKYFEFKGRATRREFWTFYIFLFLLQVAVGIFANILTAIGVIDFSSLANLVFLVTFIPSLSCSVRRLHDAGKNGWFIIVPIVNFIFLLLPTASIEPQSE